MCARITATTTATKIADLFGLAYDLSTELARQPRNNVAPTQTVPVVRTMQGFPTTCNIARSRSGARNVTIWSPGLRGLA
jgi:putative SOS response-associated peptidase YedK